jgi:threonylcarbamoyladenosine tRNA methylthiotransferase MtaB
LSSSAWELSVPAEFFVHNLGCKVNRVESDALSAFFLSMGASRVSRDEARVVVVNTCAVTATAEAKTRKAIRQALAGSRKPWVIATGCAVALDREGYQALGARVIAEPDRNRAQEAALDLLGLGNAEGGGARRGAPLRVGEGFNTRMGIKIQDGCDNACSYCVVRIARGAARSVPSVRIREQVRDAERAGVREIVLTGVNVGCYDDEGVDLCQLLGMLLDATAPVMVDATSAAPVSASASATAPNDGGLRFRLSSLEPQHATDELLALMADSKGRVCAHLHLPLQSGCDRTLAAMRRPYGTAFFAERAKRARDLMPHLALTTDVIVGFPTESDEDFRESYEFCRRMGFSRMHVFRYSRRPGTPAAEIKGQVTSATSSERAGTLRALGARMRARDIASRVGASERVLVERRGRGTSESYHQVEFGAESTPGQLITMRFTGYRDTLIQGVAEPMVLGGLPHRYCDR